jgi:Zn finger protein HypA/HybF involved in hydrogenase expression
MESEIVVEQDFRFQCACGATVVANGQMVTFCGQCGKSHRRERIIKRRLQCSCGTTIFTADETVNCPRCGERMDMSLWEQVWDMAACRETSGDLREDIKKWLLSMALVASLIYYLYDLLH